MPQNGDLTFQEFQAINAKRCGEAFGHVVAAWPIQNWSLAIAGESGELCNLVKKIIRGDFTLAAKRTEILAELADIITYCDLAITHLEADTDSVLMNKFDFVSARVKWARPRVSGDMA